MNYYFLITLKHVREVIRRWIEAIDVRRFGSRSTGVHGTCGSLETRELAENDPASGTGLTGPSSWGRKALPVLLLVPLVLGTGEISGTNDGCEAPSDDNWSRPDGGWRNGSAVHGPDGDAMVFAQPENVAWLSTPPPDCTYSGLRTAKEECFNTWYRDFYTRTQNTRRSSCQYTGGDLGDEEATPTAEPFCVNFEVRENGCGTGGSNPTENQDGGTIAMFQYLKLTPPSSGHKGGWKVWFDTRCVIVDNDGNETDKDGVPYGSCDGAHPAAVNDPNGVSPLSVELFCKDPTSGREYWVADVASYGVPVYGDLMRYEAEFYVPAYSDSCLTAGDGSYVALVLRQQNEEDAWGDQTCNGEDTTEADPTTFWRQVRVQNLKMQALHYDPDEWELGLKDYHELWERSQHDGRFDPIEGIVETSIGILTRRSGDSDPVSVEFGELWHPPGKLSPTAATPAQEGSGLPYFYLSVRSDEVFPWTIPTVNEADAADRAGESEQANTSPVYITPVTTVGSLSQSPSLPARKWIAVRNPAAKAYVQFVLPDGWRIFSVIYEPVAMPSHRLPCKTRYTTAGCAPPAARATPEPDAAATTSLVIDARVAAAPGPDATETPAADIRDP